jgi:hypothetical protein
MNVGIMCCIVQSELAAKLVLICHWLKHVVHIVATALCRVQFNVRISFTAEFTVQNEHSARRYEVFI